MTKFRKLLVFDGNNYFRRAEKTPGYQFMRFNGKLTGAMYGCIKAMLADIQALKPDEVGIAFDGYGAREKKQCVYAGYKTNRSSSMDDALYSQMLETIKILRHAGLCVLHKDGVDGDDILGAVSQVSGRSVIVSSSDKDFFQLCSDRVAVMRHIEGEKQFWYADTVEQHFGVPASQFADYLALVGDSVDNIPGLYKCGPVMATKLLKQFGSVHQIVKNRSELEPALRKKVSAQREELLAFKQLTKLDASVISDVAMKSIIPRLTPKPYTDELFPLLEQFGQKSLISWFKLHRPTVVSKPRGLFS